MSSKKKGKVVYALYRGETNLGDGTAAELAKRLNKNRNYIPTLACKRTHRLAENNPNRLMAIKIGYTTDEL